MYRMFAGATSANPDTSDWDTSSVTDMAYMFADASSANPDTSGWNTAAVTYMYEMFAGATSANPDTSGAAVTNMYRMFDGATSANPDTSGWNTSAVTNMATMFTYATSANPDTSGWDTAAVTNMYRMFDGATSANPDTSGWDTSAVVNMSSMFRGATSFDRDVGSWNVTSLEDATDMFDGVALSTVNYDSLLVGWEAQELNNYVPFNGGHSRYCSAEAAAARFRLIEQYGWQVLDSGMCPEAVPITPFTAPDLTPATDTGILDDDNLTTIRTPDFYALCSDHRHTITLYSDNPGANTVIGTHSCTHVGFDTVKVTNVLVVGVHHISYTEKNSGGESGHSPSLEVTIYNAPASVESFVTTWKTDNPGTSDSTAITVPMMGGPYEVDWNNDGIYDESGLTGAVTHYFGVADTYTVRIRGTYDFIRFDDGGDRQKIISLDQWGTQTWTTMERAFYGAANLLIPASDTPNLSVVSDMSYMFANTGIADPDISGWDTSNVTDMSHMFADTANADPDISGWDTSNVTDMSYMFLYADSANPDTGNWNTSSVDNMQQMFQGATSANPDTSNWDTSSVTDMSGIFSSATSANPDTSNWDVSSVTDMGFMFVGATSANPDTSNWDVSSVTYMGGMFKGATSANPDTSDWDTSSVTDMAYMFDGAISANPDTSSWNTSSVTSMESMFRNTWIANPDTSGWNTAAVTSMTSMFWEAISANPDTSDWDTSSVTSMVRMFRDATSFDRDIGSWNVSALSGASSMFEGVALSTANYDSLLEGWGAQTLQSSVTFDGGNSTYCSAAAVTARASMIAAYSWDITDGGEFCEPLEDVIFADGFETPSPCDIDGIWAVEARDCITEDCSGHDGRYMSWDGKFWCRALITQEFTDWTVTVPSGTSTFDFWADWGAWDLNDCGDGITGISITVCGLNEIVIRGGPEKRLTCDVTGQTSITIEKEKDGCEYVIIGNPYFY